jgi:hypothetical protein
MSGPFKMKGSPMKRNFGIGASPVKQHKKYSKRVGPAQDPEKIKKERLKYSDEYKKMEEYQKNVPKENIAFEEGETDARAYLD